VWSSPRTWRIVSRSPVARYVHAEAPAKRILTSKTELEGERKQVTVVFADLKGSMELLADRDPEDARKLLDPVLAYMMEAVHRYEGTVNQVMGDGIMALFGAPLAHEDHAVRACYAALRMQESVKRYAEGIFHSQGVRAQIRVGLNSGEVVVRSIGSDLRMDYSAVGQTTHLAARMEQMAAAGSIQLAANTLRLAEGYIEVKPLGSVPVKGLPEPVEAFELTGARQVRTRLQAALPRGLTRFVGRDAEDECLRRVLELAGAGRGQVVAVVGEAGVGKSRLTYEFTQSNRLQNWLILEAASVSFGKAMSWLPVIDLLKDYFKIGAPDDHLEMRNKVLGRVLGLDRALEPAVPPLLSLLDVPVEDPAWQMLDPPQRRQRMLDAVKRLLLRESQAQPLLVVFEDLHWIDSETQALLDSLVESLGSARLLLLVNYRPEYEHRWASKTAYSQLRLDSLPAESAAELLAALLGPDPGLAPLAEMLVKRGNPFFLEETVRTLVETGALTGQRGAYRLTRPVEALHVPATVQTILAARIDRLPAEEKQLLQAASVIGKDVPHALLEAIAEQSEAGPQRGLRHLQASEFIHETGLYLDLAYSFKHALTHEVTYRGLLRERRRQLHARVVNAIETLFHDHLGEQIERLAHHAVQGELREEAVPYLRQAGLKAAGRSAHEDARTWFEQAIAVLVSLPESPSTLEQAFDVRLDLRQTLNLLAAPRRALERLLEAETLAERLNDDRRRGLVCALLSNAHCHLGELDEALAFGTRALEIAERLRDLKLRIVAKTILEQQHYYRGEYARVVALATDDDALAFPKDTYSDFGVSGPPSELNRCWLIISLAELGRFAEAAEHASEAIRRATATQPAYTVGWAHWAAGMIHLLSGEWAQARPHIEHATAVLRAGNVALLLSFLVVSSAWGLAQLGEATEALGRLREGERLVERQAGRGYVGSIGWLHLRLGRAALLLDRLDDAQRFGDRAMDASPRQFGFAAYALHLLGDIATHPEQFDPERGATYYREALALAEPRGMRPLVAHCHLGLGKLHRRTANPEQAREHLTTAMAMYREMGMTYWQEQVEAELRQLG
jgi:class 3 adenylate cyclase/tetratricopeptide (TPR) repeat protein